MAHCMQVCMHENLIWEWNFCLDVGMNLGIKFHSLVGTLPENLHVVWDIQARKKSMWRDTCMSWSCWQTWV